jgi:transcriptional regulator with XRE-family HTH domain
MVIYEGYSMKKTLTHLPATTYALKTLGAQIAVARKELGWTAAELAERLRVTPNLVSRIENGAPSTGIGTVLEAAVLCGIQLFETNPEDLRAMAAVAQTEQLRLALLPTRTRRKLAKVPNDF